MSEPTADIIDGKTPNETEETTIESQETLESEVTPEAPDDGLTDQARAFKEKRREENRVNREKAARLDKVESELEFTKFLRKNPEAEDFEKDIQEFRQKNPTIGLEQAYKYVLADKDPVKLAQLADSGKYAQETQGKTAPVTGEKSFSDQVGGNVNLNDLESLKREAEKAYAKLSA